MVVAPDDAEVRSWVAAADARAAAGDVLGAIQQLTDANRTHRHPLLERHLVALRHQAFDTLPRTPGRADWPVDLPDPFPHETGIPAVGRAELTGDLLGGSLVHHGCLRVNGLLDETGVHQMVGYIDDGFRDRERSSASGAPSGDGDDGDGADPGSTFVPFDAGRDRAEGFGRQAFVRAVDVPAALFSLAEVFAATGVAAAVTDYFRERPAMIANKWVLRRSPSGKAGTDFHQDGAFLGAGIRTVDCWIALSDCGPGTGRPAMDLVPRRFEVLDAGEGASFPWALTEETVRRADPDGEIVSPVFSAGDALFFDERLPHRTSVGLDLTTRYAIESWFVAPSSYPSRHVPVVL